MKVQILSTSDNLGGAAKAAFRLNEALCTGGVESVLSSLRPMGETENTVAFPLDRGLAVSFARRVGELRTRLFDRHLRKIRPTGLEIFSIDRTPYAFDFSHWRPEIDLINLHWVARFVDVAAFFTLGHDLPVVWTLHDMNPFTGGCHYDSECGRFIEGCGRCPELGSSRENDISAAVFRRKQFVYDQLKSNKLHLVTPSRWLAGEAKRSTLFGKFPVSVIPNGIDTDLFTPENRDQQRQEMGILEDAKVVLFVAQDVDASRKGFSFLLEALGKIDASSQGNILLKSIGKERPDLSGIGLNHQHLGYIESEAAMSAVYAAADLLALPSLQDNLPNTMIEAMASGTPVVAFDVGGIADFVSPSETGFLAPARDSNALASKIEEALSNKHRLNEMSAKCRDIAVKECSLAVQAERYRKLFNSLIENS